MLVYATGIQSLRGTTDRRTSLLDFNSVFTHYKIRLFFQIIVQKTNKASLKKCFKGVARKFWLNLKKNRVDGFA